MSKSANSIQSSLNDIADGLLGKTQDEVDSNKIEEEKAENEVNQLNEKKGNLLTTLGLAAENNITTAVQSNEHSGVINQNQERSA